MTIGVLDYLRPVFGKVLQGLLTLLLVSLLIFVATRALPGDVANMILGQSALPEQVDALRAQLGLDQPLWWQYVTWLGGILHGDWGPPSQMGSRSPISCCSVSAIPRR